MSRSDLLKERSCWRISGVRDAAAFFRAIPLLTPNATHVFLEGAPARDVVAGFAAHLDDQSDYAAPRGTIWSFPGRNRRFTLRASAALFAHLSEAAACHAEPEICYHVHLYRNDEPLVQWFDAFDDPMLVARSVPRPQIERFCSEVGGVIS